MDALHKARELVQDAYYDERGMADVLRQDAAIWAAIAQAEQLKRIADALYAGTWSIADFAQAQTPLHVE